MSIRKRILSCMGIITLVLIIATTGYFHLPVYHYYQAKQADLNRLASEEYHSIFCSMYPIDYFAEEDFLTYLGISTVKQSVTPKNAEDFGLFLSSALASGNPLQTVYLGLDPALLLPSEDEIPTGWETVLDSYVIPYISEHPEINFQVLLPAPCLTYWEEQDRETVTEILDLYETITYNLALQANVTTFFMGGEYWLIANPANYEGGLCTNEIVSRKIFLYTFCDGAFQMTIDNIALYTESLQFLITQEAEEPEHPDLSGWDVVFLGDSIIGNYVGSYSVPGVLTGLSGARTYNCAQGGIPASVAPDAPLSFPSSVEYFKGQDASALPDLGGPYPDALANYVADNHENQRLCFVLNFGLNDYFGGYPVSNPQNPYDTATYAGALRVGIRKLQAAYPKAQILLMTPNFITQFSNGTEILGENSGILTEYVDTAIEIAKEYEISYLNNYTGLGINESTADVYLADKVHLNETGRFLLAKQIMEHLATHQ